MYFVQLVLVDDVFEDDVELVEDLDPRIQIGPRPLPRLDSAENVNELFIWRIQNSSNEFCDSRRLWQKCE